MNKPDIEPTIISKNGKYCSNPITHILGSLPCCAGLHINTDRVDPRDFLREVSKDQPINKPDIETLEVWTVLIANMVFGYNGSDPETKSRQVGVSAATNTLKEIFDSYDQSLRESLCGEIDEYFKKEIPELSTFFVTELLRELKTDLKKEIQSIIRGNDHQSTNKDKD